MGLNSSKLRVLLSLTLLACISVLQGCEVHIAGIKEGKDIPKDVKNEVDKISTTVCSGLMSRDISGINKLFHSSFSSNGRADVDSIIGYSRSAREFEPKVVGAFYIDNVPGGATVINTVKGTIDNYEYTFAFNPVGLETFVYLLEFPSIVGKNGYLLSMVMAKEGKEWKLTRLNINAFRYQDMIAPQLFDIAKQKYADSAFYEALMYAQLGELTMRPLGSFFRFRYSEDWLNLSQSIKQTVLSKQDFPFDVNNVKSIPEVRVLSIASDRAGIICPLVFYKTIIPLTDSLKINRENDLVNNVIKGYFPGIENVSDSIIYRVSNKSVMDGGETQIIKPL